MFSPILTDVLLLILVCLGLWIAFRVTRPSSSNHIATRLDEHLKRVDSIEQRMTDLKLEQDEVTAKLRARPIIG